VKSRYRGVVLLLAFLLSAPDVLGQGATMVAALWGVFVWKEFKGVSPGTGTLIALMFT
jgi:hypothetical protein